MAEQAASDSPEISIARWMWHWPLLFAAMAAPFFFIQPGSARWVSIAAGVAYGLWCIDLQQEIWSFIRRSKQERSKKQDPWTVNFFVTIFINCGAIMALGTALIFFFGWLSWAYDLNLTKLAWPVTAVLLSLILVPALFLTLAPAFGRENGGPASRLLKGIRDQGLGRFHLFWFCGSAWNLGVLCLVPITQFSGLHSLVTILNKNTAVPIWDLAVAFPVLPATFLTAAILLSAPRLTPSCRVKNSVLARTYMDGDPVPPGLDRRAKRILGLTAVGGAAATLFVVLYMFHVGWVAAQSSVAGLRPLVKTIEAVESLVAAQREAGKSTAEIAAELNRIGSWTPAAPDAGLATLVEKPKRVFVDTCSVRLAAGVTDPSAHGAFDWLPAEQAASELKYCIAVSCASPVRWEAPPALLLGSSHNSQAGYWLDSKFLDVFAEGTAPPGGYCTADGGLAEGFQG